jgi:hypothetical protein
MVVWGQTGMPQAISCSNHDKWMHGYINAAGGRLRTCTGTGGP